MTQPLTVFKLARPLVKRPDLWVTALRSYRTLVPRSWWRHRPYLPLPNAEWLHFRLVTAYGGSGVINNPSNNKPAYARMSEDMILWLEWLRDWNRDRS